MVKSFFCPLKRLDDFSHDPLCAQIQLLLQMLRSQDDMIARPPGPKKPPEAIALQQQVARFQSQFQKTLAAIAETDFPPTVEQRLRPLQTEAHRRSRLLGIEAMKLKTARSPETLTTVRSQIKAHLQPLRQFVQAIADEVCA
ncbi:MAG: hypothetical protein WA885_11245 [Phormidesmis sp.]